MKPKPRKEKWKVILRNVRKQISKLERTRKKMAIDQATFDTDLAALVKGVGDLISAIEAKIANTPAADFTAEDQAVQQAAVNVAGEINKLNPPAPVPVPASVKHKHGK